MKKKSTTPTKVEGVLTLSAYNGMHYTDVKRMKKNKARGEYRPSFAESLTPLSYLIEGIMGENWENIGKKVKVTYTIIDDKKKKEK